MTTTDQHSDLCFGACCLPTEREPSGVLWDEYKRLEAIAKEAVAAREAAWDRFVDAVEQ